ncbi:unnamed protein product [Polarella glacialis]|uniref:60S ribosomal protein L6 n=1 Tax=Polarella glacialis TaxID=89957 RepID=A0A813LS35_POLGL|nr:unnamed protein product [Polarella glacialis]
MGRAGGQITTKKTFGKKSANPRKAGKVQKVQKLKKQIAPGSVLILLAGRFRGRRVVFLKQLESGLLLVTGPFAINGVPLRRVNQRYCIATSAKTDVKGADVSTISDAYFAKEAKKGKKDKSEGAFFATGAVKTSISLSFPMGGQGVSRWTQGACLRGTVTAAYALDQSTEGEPGPTSAEPQLAQEQDQPTNQLNFNGEESTTTGQEEAPQHLPDEFSLLADDNKPESCFDDSWQELHSKIAPTAKLPLLPRRLYEKGGQDLPAEHLADTYAACLMHHHRVSIAQFDLLAYTASRPSLTPFQQNLISKFSDHLQTKVAQRIWRELKMGVATCTPRSCVALQDPEQLRKAAVEYIAYATGFGSQAAWLPIPRMFEDMNITAMYDAFGPVDFAGASEMPGVQAEAESEEWLKQQQEDKEAELKEQEAPFTSACIVGRVPEAALMCWRADVNHLLDDVLLDLEGKEQAEVQEEGRRTLAGATPRWTSTLEAKSQSRLLRRAAAIVERYLDLLKSQVLLYSTVFCTGDYHLPPKFMWAGDDFCAYHYLVGSANDTWGTRRCWNRWSGFCPLGFAAALFIRFIAAGRSDIALDDLKMASAMLGWCREFGFLDESTWAVTADGVDEEILRLQAPRQLGVVAGESTLESSQLIKDEAGQRYTMWHALQLNTLVRLHLESASKLYRPTRPDSSPSLAMLTYPSYLSLLLLPALLQVWPDLRLGLFHLGLWMRHEKCLACCDHYQEHFLVEDPGLQELPLHFEGQSSGNVAWVPEKLDHGEMLLRLQMLLLGQPRARAAEVLLCTAPLWLCTTLLLAAADSRPLLALCLVKHELGAPPDFGAGEARQVLSQQVVQPLAELIRSATGGSNGDRTAAPRTLWVREDMARSYANFELYEFGNFHPFVWLPSIYITARYDCRETADVLVMREGSLGRFATTIRGKVFYSALERMVPVCAWIPACPWGFRLLPYSKDRLSYEELARHRAAVFIPSVWYGKLTFKDLVTMEIPLFVPDLSLQAQTLCKTVRASLADLVQQLARLDCVALRSLSARMKEWNAMLLEAFELPHVPSLGGKDKEACMLPAAAYCSFIQEEHRRICCLEAATVTSRTAHRYSDELLYATNLLQRFPTEQNGIQPPASRTVKKMGSFEGFGNRGHQELAFGLQLWDFLQGPPAMSPTGLRTKLYLRQHDLPGGVMELQGNRRRGFKFWAGAQLTDLDWLGPNLDARKHFDPEAATATANILDNCKLEIGFALEVPLEKGYVWFVVEESITVASAGLVRVLGVSSALAPALSWDRAGDHQIFSLTGLKKSDYASIAFSGPSPVTSRLAPPALWTLLSRLTALRPLVMLSLTVENAASRLVFKDPGSQADSGALNTWWAVDPGEDWGLVDFKVLLQEPKSDYSCADGSAVTWGNAKSGGDSSEIAPLLMEGVVEVCANTPAFAAIKADGSVVTWGNAKIWQRFLSGCSTSGEGVVQVCGTATALAAGKADGSVADGSVVTWGNTWAGGADGSVVTWGNAEVSGDSSALAPLLNGTGAALNLINCKRLKSNFQLLELGGEADGGNEGKDSGSKAPEATPALPAPKVMMIDSDDDAVAPPQKVKEKETKIKPERDKKEKKEKKDKKEKAKSSSSSSSSSDSEEGPKKKKRLNNFSSIRNVEKERATVRGMRQNGANAALNFINKAIENPYFAP